jgi:hypothetical protein
VNTNLEPTIRWYRNNEPIDSNDHIELSRSGNTASLIIRQCRSDDVCEYKCEAISPAGKAITVANLLLKGGIL